MRIGVDVDGVIGDQVPHLLRRVRKKYGIDMKKRQIMLWDQPMGNTSFVREMDEALLDPEFVLSMPLIRGARVGLETIGSFNQTIIVTSRPPHTDSVTLEWLRRKGLSFHGFVNTLNGGKALAPVDILIDDNLENARDFVLGGRKAILLSQPWNKNDQVVSDLVIQRAIVRAENWAKVVQLLKRYEDESR